jgi:hypothetical protein
MEGMFAKQVTDGRYIRPALIYKEAQRRLEVDITSARFVAMFRYARTTGTIKPFVQAGPQVTAHLKKSGMLTNSYDMPSAPAPTKEELEIRSGGFGGVVGAGLLLPTEKGVFQVEARLDLMDSLTASGRLAGPTVVSVLVGYTIGR